MKKIKSRMKKPPPSSHAKAGDPASGSCAFAQDEESKKQDEETKRQDEESKKALNEESKKAQENRKAGTPSQHFEYKVLEPYPLVQKLYASQIECQAY